MFFCGGYGALIPFCWCRNGKVQLRRTCCADSVQVGEGRRCCYVKVQFFSSALLTLCSNARVLQLEEGICQTPTRSKPGVRVPLLCGSCAPGDGSGWVCSLCKGEVTPDGQASRVRCVMGNKNQSNTKEASGVVLTCPFPLEVALEAVQAYTDPVIWVLLGSVLINPRTSLLQVWLFILPSLSLGPRCVLWALLRDFVSSFREASLRPWCCSWHLIPGQPLMGSQPHLNSSLHFPPYLQDKQQLRLEVLGCALTPASCCKLEAI